MDGKHGWLAATDGLQSANGASPYQPGVLAPGSHPQTPGGLIARSIIVSPETCERPCLK